MFFQSLFMGEQILLFSLVDIWKLFRYTYILGQVFRPDLFEGSGLSQGQKVA